MPKAAQPSSVQERKPSKEAQTFLEAMRTIVSVRKEDLVKPEKRKKRSRPIK